MVCNFWLADSDPFCVCSLLLNFRVRMFSKCAIRFPTLCLVDWEDLCFDILLCDVNFSHFSFQFFCLFDSQGEIVPIYIASKSRRNTDMGTDMGGWKGIVMFPPTFNFAASANCCRLFLTSKDWTIIPCRSVRSSLEKQIQTVQYLLYLPLLVGSLTYKRGVQVRFFCFSINEDGTFNFA